MTDRAKEEKDKVIRQMKELLKQFDKVKEEYKALTPEEKGNLKENFPRFVAFFGDAD